MTVAVSIYPSVWTANIGLEIFAAICLIVLVIGLFTDWRGQ